MSQQFHESVSHFVVKPPVTSAEAVSLLLEKFPCLSDSGGEELSPNEPYYAYERLAEQVALRHNDPAFLKGACDFFQILAESRDRLLTDLLVVGLFEPIAENAALASKVKECLGPVAKEILQTVERDLFGR